jgi:hypothetical protein
MFFYICSSFSPLLNLHFFTISKIGDSHLKHCQRDDAYYNVIEICVISLVNRKYQSGRLGDFFRIGNNYMKIIRNKKTNDQTVQSNKLKLSTFITLQKPAIGIQIIFDYKEYSSPDFEIRVFFFPEKKSRGYHVNSLMLFV